MFGVAIDIALKVAVKSNCVLQRTLINFNKSQFQTGLTKNTKNDEKVLKISLFRLKNSQKCLFNLELRPSQ